jgi:hypothetical protein
MAPLNKGPIRFISGLGFDPFPPLSSLPPSHDPENVKIIARKNKGIITYLKFFLDGNLINLP